MRQCEFKNIKLCKLKIKLIALGWYLVTMIFWYQTNPEIHISPPPCIMLKTKQKIYYINKWKGHENLPFFLANLWSSFSWYPVFVLEFISKPNFNPIFEKHFWHCGHFTSASHYWRLHVLWRVEFKKTTKYTVKLVTSKRKHCCLS